ncbi:hypothetical protein DUI87_10564 [Hirundo rustica rustica]|uniref:Uncharacterized protein n=1 Tax=Hirundo rustica rustica TaxID=333673 RepID=A0A3M0KP48_HIRRU|nr:hypothetical protein DUI87_10564 [Hirundo rustica rustica]
MGEQQSSLSAPRAAAAPPSPAGDPREPGPDEPPSPREAVPGGVAAGPGRGGELPPAAAGPERRGAEEEAEAAAGPEQPPGSGEPPAPAEEGPEGGSGRRRPPRRHVYCTVYCVENDRPAAAPGSPRGGQGAGQPPARRGVVPGDDPLSSGGSIEVVDLYLLPEPFSGLIAGEFGPLLVLSCRVCLEEKPIKPLSCCKKAVCEECLRRYLSSQMRNLSFDLASFNSFSLLQPGNANLSSFMWDVNPRSSILGYLSAVIAKEENYVNSFVNSPCNCSLKERKRREGYIDFFYKFLSISLVQSEITSVLADCDLVESLKGSETGGGILGTAAMGEVWLDLYAKPFRSQKVKQYANDCIVFFFTAFVSHDCGALTITPKVWSTGWTFSVQLGQADIKCPITECSEHLDETTVLYNLPHDDIIKYKYFLELSRIDSSTKPCPQCKHFTTFRRRGHIPTPAKLENKYKIQCPSCQFVWCFKCHSPWHEGVNCKEYKKGDKLLRHWANEIEHGQRNAQKCPKCKIHIQRTEGCDHMTCSQCNTNFCYRCGERYRQLRFFGDHTSNLSIFGCKYRYLPERPHLRRLVRGSVCAGKLLITPLILVLGLALGAVAVVIGKLIVVGDCKHTPKEIEILPGTLDNNPGKFVLWLRCTHPPTFLPKGQTVAQIIPTWEHLEEDNIPTACPVHNITEVKPQVGCELQVGDEAINITGLLHTDMDVTVIPAKHWPSRWALENVAGHVQGIGGMQLAKQSKSVVQIKGPKGQMASLRPFVLDYREPLLGRDLMAQWGVTIDIPDPPQDFWAAVAEERPTHKLNWKTDAPVWVEQWPLSKQKLKALEELVEEQLAKGHIVETTSPWNSPVFVIRKPGKDKWRLLQDLRQINNVIEDMGSLQPGMPTPTMLPQNWKLAVIDIKDCFFHIPLHPDDAPRFAFSVPTVNREAPRKRYHWRVLPQGMKVSPIICQWYVASLLSPVRVAAEKAIIHHYMDDVLVCAPTDDVLSHALDLTINALVVAGFELQEDKVQRMPPWRYLGLEIGKRTIVPQKLEIKAKIQTLADVHQLCGALNWVRPWLGLTTEDLAPLFNLLKGGEELSSPRELTPEAKEALEKVQHLMSTRQAHRCDPDLPFKFIIMGKLPHLHGVIFQWRNNIKKDQGREDPLLIIEWVFLSHQRSKRMTRPQELVAELIRKARVRIRELAGCDFECIHIPIGLRSGQITKVMLEHLLQENEALQFALDSFTGQISIHRPAHKIFNQDAKFTLNLKDVRSRKPLEALTVFTDASGKSHKSVMTWKDSQTQQWEADVAEVEGSPQVAELAAVVRAFERFPEPFNLVTDSAYVAGVVSRADQAILQEVSNTALFELLSKLVKLVSHREQPFFVMHTRSHTDLPGFIAEGNRRADALAAPAAMAPLPSIFEQAKLSHQLHHQNAPGLVRRFHITREQAKAIVATCPSCNQHALPTLSAGVNPRGLNSCELWQTDVTHIPQFGRSKYVHVSVDTFSGAVFASAHAGEKTLDAIKHLIQAFSFMGIPKELKTDNGPAYRSKEFCSFLQQWGVGHKTSIPHSPTGQAVVERTHREIRRVLNQQQPVLKTETPQTRLARALFTLNFLNSTFEFLNPPIVRHFGANPQLNIKERPPVMVRDPETGRTEGPHDLVTWGRGYACVSTPTGPRWLPSKWVQLPSREAKTNWKLCVCVDPS